MSDLSDAFAALNNKNILYSRLYAYYDGNHPVTYTNSRLAEVFEGLDAVFIENWCAVVIDSVRERINLGSMQVDGLGQRMVDDLFYRSEINLESDEVHEACLVTGEGFVGVWPDDEGQPQAYFNDPRMCHIRYDAELPRVATYAAKMWQADDKSYRMTLYYPGRLEYYEAKSKTYPSTANGFKLVETAENPYGRIPIFHFRLSRRTMKSDLASVIPVQNGVNKLLADMMVAAEYGAFKQRYIISSSEILGKLKNSPNEIWELPAGDGMGQQTQAGQFDSTPLENYLKAIDNLALAISSITRTPKHYFFQVGSNLSGEALYAMEAGLIKKAEERIDRFKPVWAEVMAFMLEIAGVTVDGMNIEPVFDRPNTVQPKTEAETLEISVRGGMAYETALRERGWSEREIEQALVDKRAEATASQAGLGESLLSAMREFDGGEIASPAARNDMGIASPAARNDMGIASSQAPRNDKAGGEDR